MLDERYYLLQVEKLMDKLRVACLGQDTPLTAILPEHMKTAPPEEQAAQLAEQVLFTLVRAVPGKAHTPQELAPCRTWLRGTAFYLLKECRSDDHTFAQWKKLLELPRGARAIMFANFEDPSSEALRTALPPELLKEFDVAVLGALKTQQKCAALKNVYHTINELALSHFLS